MTNMRAIFTLALSLFLSQAFADVPQLINYQGKLTDANGDPKSGVANLMFEVWDSPSGGTRLWGVQSHLNTPLVDGHFNVILGPTDEHGSSISNAFFQSGNAYLQIIDLGDNVESSADDLAISPRQQVLSAPYAINAAWSSHTGNIVPSGMVVPFNRSTCPNGWAEYELAKGRFIRGWDPSGSNAVDPQENRGLATTQHDAVQNHTHGYGTEVLKFSQQNRALGRDDAYVGVMDVGLAESGQQNSAWKDKEIVPISHPYGTRWDVETRPKNVALLYCYKQ